MYKDFFSREMEKALASNELDPKMLRKHEAERLISILGHNNICFLRRKKNCNGHIKVSIIIPVYNNEEHLANCLESVLRQSLKEIEIICINDGSNDMSSSILDMYLQKDNRISVFDKFNGGSGSARNIGIEYCSGEYIAFMDADDFYPTDDAIEILYNNAKKEGVDAVGGNMVNYTSGIFKPTSLKRKNEKIEYVEEQCDYGYTTYIFKRQLLYRYNIKFPDYKRYQDPPFLVRALFASRDIAYLDYDVYAYRFEKKSMNAQQIYDILLGLLDVLEFSSEKKLEKLHTQTVRRLCNDFFDRIKSKGNDEKIKERVSRFYSLIDFDLLKKNQCTQGNINYFNRRIHTLM